MGPAVVAPAAASRVTRPAPFARCRRRARVAASANTVTITTPEGQNISVDKDQYIIGSASTCDLVVKLPNVFPEHACVARRGQQVFCTALSQQGESLLDAQTFTWLDGVQLRKGPSYLLAAGSVIAIGEEGRQYTVQFQEGSGANPMLEMMIKALTANASDDVKQALPDNLK